MGLFNNYAKPGKGVEKDEKRPIGLIMYFTLLGRKFGSYVKLNFMYALTCIPSIFVMFFLISSFMFDLSMFTTEDLPIVMSFSGAFAIAISMIFGLSPFSSGYYYILRNFAREEHSWMSDFWEIFRKNMKYSILSWIIDTVIIAIAIVSLRVYGILLLTNNSLYAIPIIIMLLAFVVFALSNPYKWTIMVTFESSLKDIYKNSMFFVMGNFWRSLMQFIFSAVYITALVIFSFLFSIIAYIVIAVIGFSLFGLIQAVTLYPVIAKYTNQE